MYILPTGETARSLVQQALTDYPNNIKAVLEAIIKKAHRHHADRACGEQAIVFSQVDNSITKSSHQPLLYHDLFE